MHKKYSNEDLLNQIRLHVKLFGIIPTTPHNAKAPKHLCRYQIFKKRFGSWNKAIVLAGYEPNRAIIGEINCVCSQCSKTFTRGKSKIIQWKKKSDRIFCSKTCAATYNNTHKTHGYRRSKLEAYIETKLTTNYPNLEIHFNRKDTINSELDIYIPSLNLAFELNGIFHYEPIYSDKQFSQIQNNDKRKFQACLEKNIELCIIDSSLLSYFKPEKAEKYYQIVKQIIDTKLVRHAGIEPTPQTWQACMQP